MLMIHKHHQSHRQKKNEMKRILHVDECVPIKVWRHISKYFLPALSLVAQSSEWMFFFDISNKKNK